MLEHPIRFVNDIISTDDNAEQRNNSDDVNSGSHDQPSATPPSPSVLTGDGVSCDGGDMCDGGDKTTSGEGSATTVPLEPEQNE